MIQIHKHFKYTIEPKQTEYRGIKFRSRLEAKWAAFFSFANLKWEYEPLDLKSWTPDFYIEIPCWHSECPDNHPLYIEVKPLHSQKECKDYLKELFDFKHWYDIPSPAVFGTNPEASYWEMIHGHGSGTENIARWIKNADKLWRKACNEVQWRAD